MTRTLSHTGLTIEDKPVNGKVFHSLSSENQWKVIAIYAIAALYEKHKIAPLTPERFDMWYDMPLHHLEGLKQLMYETLNRIEGE
jgi:hypothetical protein